MKREMTIIRQQAYFGNFENAIRILCEVIEAQQREIEELKGANKNEN